ncbi:MAG: response regulator [Bacteroidota bacterium]
MEKKLNCVLLVDDDEATNFIHKMIIKDHGCCENIVFRTDGEKALDYLHSDDKQNMPIPDIIFLDINMPRLNGWEFLEQYKNLQEDQRAKIVVIMLTTSLNKFDKEKAEGIEFVAEYRNKPLNSNVLDEIIAKYFDK